MMAAPWYLPPQTERPGYVDYDMAEVGLLPQAGPPGATPGGRCLGGALVRGQAYTWQQPGWWLIDERPEPRSLRRALSPQAEPLPLLSGVTVWVPLLLDGSLAYHSQLVHRHTSVENGSLQVVTRVEHQALADRLLAVLRAVANSEAIDLEDATIWQLAGDLLALTHQVGPCEIAHWRWLVDDDPVTVLLAAAELRGRCDDRD